MVSLINSFYERHIVFGNRFTFYHNFIQSQSQCQVEGTCTTPCVTYDETKEKLVRGVLRYQTWQKPCPDSHELNIELVVFTTISMTMRSMLLVMMAALVVMPNFGSECFILLLSIVCTRFRFPLVYVRRDKRLCCLFWNSISFGFIFRFAYFFNDSGVMRRFSDKKS